MDDLRFEQILLENERLIHHHIRHLGVHDSTGEFFAEGQVALWQASLMYDEKKGSFSTFISWKIRNALIDYIRKHSRQKETEKIYKEQLPPQDLYTTVENQTEDLYLWQQVRSLLSENQWKWIHYFIIHDYSVEQISSIEGVSKDAVKNWGRHARNKLKAELNVDL
ncbi:sigma-70 family RNA polymerase sigma factor [Halobacillus locisalis]|uniref:Sigma-70 family RNA polymerase sigma factor n=1 Tax=Halobacillus locisalis TaxID=220753 RepID=A0A838CUF0_9BACI|nr:sigma-70 family RNA polymerase sigma factor [Halobacillus locisalis]MBA2175528.1 sigma-70 family RNA polymerase sigma factor [Halobacillus locisalis]